MVSIIGILRKLEKLSMGEYKKALSQLSITALNYRKTAENEPKISASGQTCGQRLKMGLLNPRSREEQAHSLYCENARFREDLRENKRKSDGVEKINTTSDFGLSDKT